MTILVLVDHDRKQASVKDSQDDLGHLVSRQFRVGTSQEGEHRLAFLAVVANFRVDVRIQQVEDVAQLRLCFNQRGVLLLPSEQLGEDWVRVTSDELLESLHNFAKKLV